MHPVCPASRAHNDSDKQLQRDVGLQRGRILAQQRRRARPCASRQGQWLAAAAGTRCAALVRTAHWRSASINLSMSKTSWAALPTVNPCQSCFTQKVGNRLTAGLQRTKRVHRQSSSRGAQQRLVLAEQVHPCRNTREGSVLCGTHRGRHVCALHTRHHCLRLALYTLLYRHCQYAGTHSPPFSQGKPTVHATFSTISAVCALALL